jgi:hypothetical protein
LTVSGGQVLLTPGADKVLRATGVTISSGKIDLSDNAMIVAYSGTSPISSFKALIAQGYGGGAWTGSGLTSSASAAAASSTHPTALGYGEASAIGITSIHGESIDSPGILVRYVYSGDANLDGAVTSLDFTAMATNFNGSGKYWTGGDFNSAGIVNALDFNALATNFGQALATPALGSVVPEPAAGVVALCAMALAARRRKSR